MQLYPIETHSWVAIDLIENYLDHYPTSCKKLGSSVCRDLLKNLQQQVGLTGKLIETDFPYYVEATDQQRWYVSFSHSRQHVAVLISRYPQIGIDIEDGIISDKVATRFFSTNECNWLNSMPDSSRKELRSFLWRLKECYIKTYQNNAKQLIKELKKDRLYELGIENFVSLSTGKGATHNLNTINLIISEKKIIGNFQALPCSFIILNN